MSDSKTILVIGATGFLGQPVARELNDRGWTVRVMGRDEARLRQAFGDGFELAVGDAEDEGDLRRALAGCDAVHVTVAVIPDWHLERRVVEAVVPLAAELGVQRIGYVSGASVDESRAAFALIDAKLRAEAALRDGGVPYTVFRPTNFMDMLERMAQGGKAMVLGKQALPSHFLALQDYARMVARAYEVPEAAGKTLQLRGPEAMTMGDAMQRYCDAAGNGLTVKHMPLWMMGLIATLKRTPFLQGVVEMMRYFETHGELGDRAEADRLLGPATITLEQWAARADAA